jgi:hypothetical protein
MENTPTLNETSVSARPDYGMPVHPACELFPLMDADALAKLAQDIRANGLNHPIVIHDGQIVDGRNRLLACRQAGIEPRFVEWKQIHEGNGSLVGWIRSENLPRRHLTLDQITLVETGLYKLEEQAAALQREMAGKSSDGTAGGRGRRKNPGANSTQGFSQTTDHGPGRTREKLAKRIGTTEHKVRQAMVVADDPELLRQVAQGDLSLREAEKRIRASAPPSSKRKQIIENAAKRRMIEGLSHIRGTCQGLFELNLSALRNACSVEDATTWAATARELSRQLRVFSSKLMPTKGEEQQ